MKKLRIRPFGIGTLRKLTPLLSIDSKYLFTIGDQCVYVWTIERGDCLRRISIEKTQDNSSNIVSISINPHNRLQLCIALDYGSIQMWDYEDGIRIHTIEHSCEIISIHSVLATGLYVFGKTSKNLYSLNFYSTVRNGSSSVNIFDKLPCLPKSISFDKKGDLCVFINQDGNHLYLFNLKSKQMKSLILNKKNLSFHDKLTCIVIHPDSQCLALGTQSGRILLWFDYLDHQSPINKSQMSYLHWHSLPVLCLTFSSDGSYLLSGGHECVLVKWFYQTSQPTFRPRLGAPLIALLSSNDQTFHVTMHSDNTLQIIRSNLSVKETIAGFHQTSLSHDKCLTKGIHLFLRQRAIVMNGVKPGYLQFLSIDNGKLLYQLDIVGENYVSPTELTSECQLTDVKCLAFDRTETWLVTFEERNSNLIDDDLNERKLRFWTFQLDQNQFQLNTTITYPHGQKTINQLLFHPTKLELATTGNDGFMKIWIFLQENSSPKFCSHWRCLSAYTHRSYRSEALCYYQLCSSSNQIHSYLSCSFQHLINVWIDRLSIDDHDSQYEYSKCFAHFDRNNFVQSINYGCQTLLVCHQTLVNIWNCQTGLFLRQFAWNVHSIAQHPQSSMMAIFEKNFVHFYSFIDGKCHTRKNSLFRRVQSSIFLPHSSSSTFTSVDQSRLILSLAEQGLKMLVDEDEDDQVKQDIHDLHQTNSTQEHLLTKLIVQSQHQSSNQYSLKRRQCSIEDLSKFQRKSRRIQDKFVSTPSYLLPSIDNYAKESLKQMLTSNETRPTSITEKTNSIDEIFTFVQ